MAQAKILRDLARVIEDNPESNIEFLVLVISPEQIRVVKPEDMKQGRLVSLLGQATLDLSEKLDDDDLD